jgi:hypothetical protein
MMEEKNLPLFIIGCPRSGTTLMRLIFNSHPYLAIPDETGIFDWLYNRPFYKKLFPLKASKNQVLVKSLGEAVTKQFDALPASKRKSPRAIIDFLLQSYAQREQKSYWGEKTPLNIHYLATILDIYPSATIVYMIRDPRAVASSFKRYVDYKRGKEDFWITRDVNKAIKLWKASVEQAMHFKDQITFVKYEDFVMNPESTIHRLCEKMGLTYYQKMFEFYKSSSPDNYEVWHQETTKPVNQSNIDKWQAELSEQEIKAIESALGVYMEKFDYQQESKQVE